MNIVIIYSKFAPFHIARLEAASFMGKKQGHQLVGIEIAHTQTDYQWPDTTEPGKHYSRVTLFPGQNYWTVTYRSIQQALYRVLEDLQPDVVILPGWGTREALAGLSWCLRRGIPRVVISDSQPSDTDTPQAASKLWIKRLLVRRFQAGLAGGKPHVRYLADLGLPSERCFVGCDVVDNDFFAQVSRHRSEPLGKGKPALLSCLRLIPVKNVFGALDVLATEATQWRWTIAGDGPQRPEIERRIKALGLEGRVCLLGYVDYFRLPQVYTQGDVYLQPSLSDTWGLAVNEAMAYGLPVLVSDRCGCHEDLVQEGVNGFTFDPTNPGTLAMALDRLLACKDRWGAMGQASRAIITQWGLDLFAKNLWQACESALRPIPEGPGARAVTKALGYVLSYPIK